MVVNDSIQRSSSLPIPSNQTILGKGDLVAPTSPAAIKQDQDDFEAFHNQGGITLLRKDGPPVDGADLYSQGSVYIQPGVNIPL